jgi:uncharacterized repeat protein (TIGR03837 family)
MQPVATSSHPLRWDIFCSVIDNYGDIGVTWRLARQLVQEHQQIVQLWVDDLTALAMMCPTTDTDLCDQTIEGVRIRHWQPNWQPVPPAEVTVEAFGCNIPDAYLNAMVSSPTPSLWLNLEYLSAEGWVEECHGLPSKLTNNLQKYFFFPGFSPKTGGLLREADVISRRDQLQGNADAQRAYLASRGVFPQLGAMTISLFSYESPQLASWLDELSRSHHPICLLVPQGRVLADLQRWLGVDPLRAGDHHSRGALDIDVLAFSTQDDYDRLLWCCDFNIVRGEDSFIRAQWSGQPFLWHIYPQDEAVHLVKLQSFLDLYTQDLSETAKNALQRLWLNWNNHEVLTSSWQELIVNWPELQRNAQQWCNLQIKKKNLAQTIVAFTQERLLCRSSI